MGACGAVRRVQLPKMTTLTFYGSVGEIGGNKILLTDNETCVSLDFGTNLGKERKYYKPPYLQLRNENHLYNNLEEQGHTPIELERGLRNFKLLSSTSLSKRYKAAKALAFFDSSEASDSLVKKLNDTSEHIYVRLLV